jgi:predicted AAA+ superfamily ATPase
MAWDKLSTRGGMPFLWEEDLDEDDRSAWLKDYCLTYLQRDLADLARLDRLEPFVRAQRVAALRSAQCLNFSDLARAADIAPTTARSFLRYLELSYQVVLVPAWSANEEKRLVKMPKLHFLDAGIRRSLVGKQGPPDGAEFESMVFAELHKLVRNASPPWRIHHLRTADGEKDCGRRALPPRPWPSTETRGIAFFWRRPARVIA